MPALRCCYCRQTRAADVLGHSSDLLHTRFLGPVTPEQVRAALTERRCWRGEVHQRHRDGRELLRSYPEADALVQFEAERTVPALLLDLLDHGRRPTGVHAGQQPDLDLLPPPAWHAVRLALDDDDVMRRVKAWITPWNTLGVRRCGVARTRGADGSTVVTAVAVDALADLSPLPTTARVGQWITVVAAQVSVEP